MSKKTVKRVKDLFADLISEKDIKKKADIITKILENMDKEKEKINFSSELNIDAIIDKTKDLETSKSSEKITLWAKLILELIRFFPNYKQRLIGRVFKAASQPQFTDDYLKLLLYNTFVNLKEKTATVNVEDKVVLESTLVFLLFTQSMKEGAETTLELFRKILVKLDPTNLPYYLLEFSTFFLCFQAFRYNYEIFSQNQQQIDDNQDTLKRKLNLCFEIIDAIQEKQLITRRSTKEVLVFLYIFFSGTFSGKASYFYTKFNYKEQRAFERGIIDLLTENGVLRQLKQLDDTFNSNLQLLYTIIPEKSQAEEEFINFKAYIGKGGPCQKHHEAIKRFIWNSAIEKIFQLCWTDNAASKTNRFEIPNEVIWRTLASFSKEPALSSHLLETITVFINSFKEDISFEWKFILMILKDILSEMSQIKKTLTANAKRKPTVTSGNKGSSTPLPMTPGGSSASETTLNEYNENSERVLSIFKLIFDLYIKSAFKGDVDELMNLLYDNPDFSNETIIIWKIRLALQDNETFSLWLSSIFYSFFLNQPSNLCKEYVLDSIQHHYKKVYFIRKYAEVVEILIAENNASSINAIISGQYSLASYSSCLISLLNLTQSIKSFKKLVEVVLSVSNEKLVLEFQKKTSVTLLSRLIASFQKEKISIVFKVMDETMKRLMKETTEEGIKKHSPLVETIIHIYNHFFINKYNELHVHREGHQKKRLSCIIIHSPDDKPETEEKDIAPYRLIPINNFLRFLLFLNKSPHYNKECFYEILRFFIKQLRYMFFFHKSEELPQFLTQLSIEQLSKEEVLFDFISRNNIMPKVQQIFYFVNYHYSTPTGTSSASALSAETKCFNELLKNEKAQDNIRLEIISLAERYLESMFNSIAGIIRLFNYYCQQPNNSVKLIHLVENCELLKENFNHLEGMTFEMNFHFIRYFFNLLEFYYFSFSDYSVNESTTVNFYSHSKADPSKHLTNQLIVSLFAHFLILLKKYRQLIFYQYDIAFGILKILFMLKEVLLSYDENRIIEIIHLIVCICWPSYEKEWTASFKKEFSCISEMPSMKTEKKKEAARQDSFKRTVLVEGFGDAVIMFYVEKITNGKKLLRIIQKVLENPESSIRQRIFLDLCKWNLTSRANRDNIKSVYRRKVPNNAEVYYDNLNLISIIPVDPQTVEMIVRNPIANINMTITSMPSVWKEEENAELKLEELINKKNRRTSKELSKEKVSNDTKSKVNEDNEADSIEQLRLDDTDTYQPQQDYLFLSFYKQLSCQNFTNNNITNSFQQTHVKLLDSSSVYISANCSVFFLPDITPFSVSSLFSYQGSLSPAYITFINSLGKTFAINEENANIFLVNDTYKNKEGLYSIYYQDTVFQIIFFCINLILPKEANEIEPTRRYFFRLNFINIIWMDNPFSKFNPSLIQSEQTLVYIVIYPYSASHYFIKLKFTSPEKEKQEDVNRLASESIAMIKRYVQQKTTIHIGKDCKELANYLQKVIIIINTIVNYALKKSLYDKQMQKESPSKADTKDNVSLNNWYSRYDQLIDIVKTSEKSSH